jgi:hypothetical protein
MGVAMVNCSSAQSPKSISLQRSLQNGLNGLLGENSATFLQFGQATVRIEYIDNEDYLEKDNCDCIHRR